MTGDSSVHLHKQALDWVVRGVAQRPEERLTVWAVKDVEQRLIDRLVIRLGAEADFHRTTANRKPKRRHGNFHRYDHLTEAALADGSQPRQDANPERMATD